jgi:hypothetical protein
VLVATITSLTVLGLSLAWGGDEQGPERQDLFPQEGESVAQGSQEFDEAQLEGPDPKVAELAAHRLFQTITNPGTDDATRKGHVTYLLQKLSFSQPESRTDTSYLVGGRIVDVLATWITSSGPPFRGVSEAVLPLVGDGPLEFRDAVIRAVSALIFHEELAGESLAVAALAGRFLEIPPPPKAYVRDASGILWQTNGKVLIGSLVGVLMRYSTSVDGSPGFSMATLCLEELRSRLPLDFPAADFWQEWWNEHDELPLDKILASAERRARGEYLTNWRKIMNRLMETRAPERVLLAIQDTLESSYSLELRSAAVEALGEFSGWVQQLHLSTDPDADSGAEEGLKDRLLTKSVQMLVSLFGRQSICVERADVLRTALAALRKNHGFLERNPDLRTEVAVLVVDRIHQLAVEGHDRNPEDLLEIIRLAGQLRVKETRGFVESLVRDAYASSGPRLELLTAAIDTLGRLLNGGANEDTAALLMGHFKRRLPAGSEKAVRGLKRACIKALSTGSESPAVRAQLRELYKEILLDSADRDLHVPAILGLGTLARQNDTESLGELIDVLARQAQFEPGDVKAAIEEIAYVGGETALSRFLDYLCVYTANDKAVRDHLLRKIGSLVAAGAPATFGWTLKRMLRLATEEDSSICLEYAEQLCAEPELAALLSSDNFDLASHDKVESLLEANLARAAVQDALGMEEAVGTTLEGLSELVQKLPDAGEKFSKAVAVLTALKASRIQRAALKGRLVDLDAVEDVALIKDFETLLTTDGSLTGRASNFRWILRQLFPEAASVRLVKVRALWHTFLVSELGSAFWEGFSPKYRERYLGRLESTQENKKEKKAEGPEDAAEGE